MDDVDGLCDSGPALMRLEHVGKKYDTSLGELWVVHDVTLDVQEGEILAVVGPSGCGKTSLLRLMAGMLPPTEGRIHWKDAPLKGPLREIGLIFQKANLMPWRTVRENVLLPLQVQGLHKEAAEKRARDAIALVGLEEFAGAYPRELSGGMEQRVAIARAFAHDPELLLLDEPFGALDALTRERLNLELMRILRAKCKTAVIVTHDIREAVFLADRVLVLTERPASVEAFFEVDLPRPRRPEVIYTEPFNSLAHRIRLSIGG